MKSNRILLILVVLCPLLLALAALTGAWAGSRASADVPLRSPVGATPTETPSCAPSWQVVSSPNDTGANRLNAVAAISSNDVWAVGEHSGQTLILHWDGIQWSTVPSPNVPGVTNVLLAVSAVSSNDVWAVGYSGPPPTPTATPTSSEPTSTPTSTATHTPTRTQTPTRTPTGVCEPPIPGDRTLTMHWDGSAWSIVPSPNMGNNPNHLRGVTAIASNDVWAVGVLLKCSAFPYNTDSIKAHWDGMQWTTTLGLPSYGMLSTYLNGVAASSSNNVWAVGYGYWCVKGCRYVQVFGKWDGSGYWRAAPNYGGPEPRAVTAVSPNDFWAVGGWQQFQSIGTEHWTGGTQWSMVSSPNVGTLNGVDAVAANDMWAVGQGSASPPIIHWDGTQWSSVTNPQPSGVLKAVSAVSATDIWAVGYSGNNTLIERYGVPCAITPTPSPTYTPTSTPTPLLIGHVTWQGPPSQPHPGQQQPITLTLKSNTIEVNYPAQTTDPSGLFTVTTSGLPDGTYSWRVKGSKSLANMGSVNLTSSGQVNVEMGLMLTGDANNSNQVSLLDFNILKVTFGKSCGDVGYDERAEFTADCVVNISEFTLLKANYGMEGAPPIRPGRP